MPLCLCGCGMMTKRNCKYVGYHFTQTEEYKKKQRNKTIELMKDPEYKQKRDNAVRKTVQSYEYRKKQSELMKEITNKKENIERVRKQVKDNWDNNPERKQKLSERMKKRWTDEERKLQAEIMTERFKDENYRKKHSEGLHKEGVKDKISLGGLKRRQENNPAWKGGVDCEPYCEVWNDREYKESIKERDEYNCKHPECWGNSKILVIHHINYIKKDCSPKNLITLCNSCNSRVNKDRQKWTNYFNEIIG